MIADGQEVDHVVPHRIYHLGDVVLFRPDLLFPLEVVVRELARFLRDPVDRLTERLFGEVSVDPLSVLSLDSVEVDLHRASLIMAWTFA
jgi:hypothetical protein